MTHPSIMNYADVHVGKRGRQHAIRAPLSRETRLTALERYHLHENFPRRSSLRTVLLSENRKCRIQHAVVYSLDPVLWGEQKAKFLVCQEIQQLFAFSYVAFATSGTLLSVFKEG